MTNYSYYVDWYFRYIESTQSTISTHSMSTAIDSKYISIYTVDSIKIVIDILLCMVKRVFWQRPQTAIV